MWCQGFSEPGTGSDLASLSCRAVPDGDAGDGVDVGDQRPEGLDEPGAVLRSVRAAHAHRRRRSRATAGSPRSSSTWTRPGITVAPLEMINGVREFAEVFFDDVVVPADRDARRGERRLGRRDEHPALRALVVLLAAHRVPVPPARAGSSRSCPTTTATPRSSATRSCTSTRCAARSRATQHRLAAGATLGAETSIDKVLVATAEHATYDAVRRLLPGVVETGRRRGGARCGATSTSTRAPRRSTAAPPRCSATSSPAGCSTSGATT